MRYKNYFVAMATYSFGFAGRRIYVANTPEEAKSAENKMSSRDMTDFTIYEVKAPNKKAAAAQVSAGKSMFAGAFAGIDITVR